MTEIDGGDIKDSIFYFHESWASMSIQEEPLSEDALVALFELVAAKYDLDEVRLHFEEDGPSDEKDGYAWFRPEDQSIHVKRVYKQPSHLMHEFAHALTQDQAPNWHGRVMLDRYLDLIREFMGEEAHAVFKLQFRNFREQHLM